MSFSSNPYATRNHHIIMRYHLFFLLFITALAILKIHALPSDCVQTTAVVDQQLALRFNTRSACPGIQLKMGKHSFSCSEMNVSHQLADYHKTKQNYTTFIHNCSMNHFQYQVETEYNLYDSQGAQLLLENKRIRIKNPHEKDQEIRLLHVADWGPLTKPKDKLTGQKKTEVPITDSLVAMIKEGKADCLIINGDIGYELNSNASFHEMTMEMIGEVASLAPLIINRGNHQENKENNTVGTMFEDYFELYDLQVLNATGITIGSLFFVIIDPAQLLIPKNKLLFDQKAPSSSLAATEDCMKQAFSQGKTILAFTHYPLACGYPSTKHCLPDQKRGQFMPLYVNLVDFYRLVLQYRAPLVFSGHVHHYERSQRLISDYRYIKSKESVENNETRYVFDSNFFIQVVDGAGGSNDGILKKNESFTWPGFVARHDEESTGFGLLTANDKELNYKHYRLQKDKRLQQFDSFVIQLPQKENIQDDL